MPHGWQFDFFGSEDLPAVDVDLVLCSDLLYNRGLAKQLGIRCAEAVRAATAVGAPPPSLLVTDSQRFPGGEEFIAQLDATQELPPLVWREALLERVTGSGLLVDGDQTYNISARYLWTGLPAAASNGGASIEQGGPRTVDFGQQS